MSVRATHTDGAVFLVPLVALRVGNQTQPHFPWTAVVRSGTSNRGLWIVPPPAAHGISSDANQSDVMAAAVDVLIRDYDLIDRFDSFPYVPGEKTAVLNSEPVHPTGEEMVLSRELSSGYYLFTGLSKEGKQRYVTRFADLCGLTVEFDGQW